MRMLVKAIHLKKVLTMRPDRWQIMLASRHAANTRLPLQGHANCKTSWHQYSESAQLDLHVFVLVHCASCANRYSIAQIS